MCCHAGYGKSGALGDGRSVDSAVPMGVSGGLAFTQVSTGFHIACGLVASGAAWCWGESTVSIAAATILNFASSAAVWPGTPVLHPAGASPPYTQLPLQAMANMAS